MDSVNSMLDAFAQAIQRSALGAEMLGSDWLRGGRFVRAFDGVMSAAFRRLGFGVKRERDNPWLAEWRREHSDQAMCQQRVDYLLTRKGRPAGIAELESLDRAQMMTFKCQYSNSDSGKPEYYWATVDHLVAHPEMLRPDFFLFVLALPDFAVNPYVVWDTSDEAYYGVNKADRRVIYRSPYRFYDPRIKHLLRERLVNHDPEATRESNWLVNGRRLSELQEVCELVVLTLTGPELILSRGRDLFAPAKEARRTVSWSSAKT